MMITKKRHHPLVIVFHFWGYIKTFYIPAIVLFIIRYDSDAFIWKYGRYAFIIITILTGIGIVIRWLTVKYELKEQAFYLYKGMFNKEEQIVPFNRVQNINRHTTFFHRVLKRTSIQFETGMSGENATVSFKVVSLQEANQLEAIVESFSYEEQDEEALQIDEADEKTDERMPTHERIVHFTPTHRDTIRASFTSFSFLILIPIVLSIYSKVENFFNIEGKVKAIVDAFLTTWWFIVILVIGAIALSFAIGMVRIHLKYGKYEIASDEDFIYITQGILNETSFSIAKNNVQAINIEQSLIKRLLGIVEIKLISVGRLDMSGEQLEINSLYPFLPKKRAYPILAEILPVYDVKEKMNKLSITALWLDFIRKSLLYILPSIALVHFKPVMFGIEQTWWISVILLFVLINSTVILNYKNSRYLIHDQFVQVQQGYLGISLFISNREKIIETSITQSVLQKRCRLATLEIINRAKPIHQTRLAHVPIQTARIFYDWYKDRTLEIELEDDHESNKYDSEDKL